MTVEEKLSKAIKLADAMYNRMQNLTTDTSGIRKAMDEYHQFIINEYYKEDTEKDFGIKNSDLEEACDEYYDETWDEHGGKAMVVDGCHDIWFPSQATDDFFKAGAQWQKEQDQSTIELAEDHAMLAGMEKMKEEMIDKVCKWLAKHWRKYVWLTDNDVIHFGHWEYDLKRVMEE